ncbi:Ribosomal RNA adenine methylase transferase [Kalmanozyma brasiliensis GHG001]|uniref:rRNA adenine N(6)-methyltransferase n=1 Tax=Kalmanozyma brasiliensis (strain GHG001) TaxID=1365824 RepID=V5E419_KALBG|nr:Ribosomal RNA adenine methylase transferase [Kalmanozyma brasiliensis GHG001]EST04931.1 Ribosomal RNA adenine methylase transferase [Kalmanozyma brasiliensis GHG001]
MYSQPGPSSRTLRTSAILASTSSSSATETANEIKPEKPIRKRRSREEIEAAKLAKEKLGIPIRSQRKSRLSLKGGGAAAAPAPDKGTEKFSERKRTKPRPPKVEDPGRVARREVRMQRLAMVEAQADEVPSAELMEQLLEEMRYDHLPPRDTWKEEFPNGKKHLTSYRYFVSNRTTIKDMIKDLGIEGEERKGEKVTIVEGYPGPGTFASEFLKMDQVEKVIALEDAPCFLEKLEKLQAQLEDEKPGTGSRLDIVKSSAYQWDTYSELVSSGKLAHLNDRVTTSDGKSVEFTTNDFKGPDHSDASWQELSPLLFFAQLPNTVYGEQLFAQIISAIASRSWLFRHGRIQLAFTCGESLAKRCLAEAGDKISRGKLGTTVQCLADVKVHRYAHELAPHTHHFFPPSMSVGPRVTISGTSLIPNSNRSTGLTRIGMVMMTVTPKKDPLVKGDVIEAFEYITRNLFILRTKPVGVALTHVAPGGQNVLKMTSPEQVAKGLIREDEVIRPEEIVSDLTNAQWACLARMFEKWPFRPRHLFEEGRIKPDHKGRH